MLHECQESDRDGRMGNENSKRKYLHGINELCVVVIELCSHSQTITFNFHEIFVYSALTDSMNSSESKEENAQKYDSNQFIYSFGAIGGISAFRK